MAINTLFDNIADAIREKLNSTDTYTPAQMPDAIRSIETGGGVEVIQASVWENMSTAEKQSYELVAIQSSNSGYERGILVNGADFIPISEQAIYLLPYLQNYANNMDYTFTFGNINYGEVDLTNVNIIGLYVDAVRGGVSSNFDTQVGAMFLSNGTNNLVWDSVANYASKKNITSTSEGVQQLFRNAYTGGNKWLIRRNSRVDFYPSYGFVSFSNGIDCTTYNKWLLYTANDGSERDPISYGLILGNLTDEGIIYDIFDYGENRTGTTNRNALAYTGDIEGHY